MTRVQLDVPQKGLEALQAAGVIASRMRRSGCIVEQWWYLPEHLPAAPERPAPAKKAQLWACAGMSFEDVD